MRVNSYDRSCPVRTWAVKAEVASDRDKSLYFRAIVRRIIDPVGMKRFKRRNRQAHRRATQKNRRSILMHSDLMHGFDGQQIGSNVQVILTGSLVDIVYSVLGSFASL